MFSRDFSSCSRSPLQNSSFFFVSLEATGQVPFRSVCALSIAVSNLQQATSSFSAAGREQASAHYIRPNVTGSVLALYWQFHKTATLLVGRCNQSLYRMSKIGISAGCQAYQLDCFIHQAPKSKQGDICVKSCSQSVACPVVFRQATRQGSPPPLQHFPLVKGKLGLASQAMKNLYRCIAVLVQALIAVYMCM